MDSIPPGGSRLQELKRMVERATSNGSYASRMSHIVCKWNESHPRATMKRIFFQEHVLSERATNRKPCGAAFSHHDQWVSTDPAEFPAQASGAQAFRTQAYGAHTFVARVGAQALGAHTFVARVGAQALGAHTFVVSSWTWSAIIHKERENPRRSPSMEHHFLWWLWSTGMQVGRRAKS
jgi:hypothetical protein